MLVVWKASGAEPQERWSTEAELDCLPDVKARIDIQGSRYRVNQVTWYPLGGPDGITTVSPYVEISISR